MWDRKGRVVAKLMGVVQLKKKGEKAITTSNLPQEKKNGRKGEPD